MKTPLLDLKLQYKSIKNEIDSAVMRVIESQNFILGSEVEQLEKSIADYVGTKYAIGVSSGTDALLIALMALDLKPDDEIIVPTFSFFATAGVVSRLNAIPVFVDVDEESFNIDPNEIEKKITSKTRGIIPVHLYGQSSAMDEIMSIAKKYNLFVIEDGAQAIGTEYKNGKRVGSIGDIGCFSFFPSKNLGCFGDGGIVTTNDSSLAEKLNILRMHGSKPKYYHKIIGGNFRIDALQSAVLNVKLPHLNSWTNKRKENAELYHSLFLKSGLAQEGKKSQNNLPITLPKAIYKNDEIEHFHIYNQYNLRVDRRDELKDYLLKNEIGAEIYYPVAFHNQECFKNLPTSKDNFPIADQLVKDSLAIPIFPELTIEQIEFVASTIINFYKNN
ncbi:MAG: DegT/DnrJ/EryC1/StrS family aminotransferase [Bacteroidota bacterium]